MNPPLTTGAASGRNELILLVDDESSMQELSRSLLECEGYRVLVATNGAEAVELYRKHGKEIDLVVLDLLMPEMDGGIAYQELKKINDSVKAFFCTGYTPDESIRSLLKGEKLHALQKPFPPAAFVQMVRAVLDEE